MNKYLKTSIQALENNIVPWSTRQAGGSKKSAKAPDGQWRKDKISKPDQEKLVSWFGGGHSGIGLICGEISGNLEAIDFDDRDAYHRFGYACQDAGIGALWRRVAGGYLERSPKGMHTLYRCTRIEGNIELAARLSDDNEKKKTLIETRGEGGFIVIAPSNIDGGSYELIDGGLDKIQDITPEEREALHSVARALCEMPKKRARPKLEVVRSVPGERPGDLYTMEATWAEILEPHGWQMAWADEAGQRWTRPGRDPGKGDTSAIVMAEQNCLYVHSTNAHPFEAGESYTVFGAYAELEHNGDFTRAAAKLAEEGHSKDHTTEVDLTAIIMGEAVKKEEQDEPVAKVSDFLSCPGLVGELAAHIEETNPDPQPIFALAAALSISAVALGQKVKTEEGIRPNLFTIILGASGAGKNNAVDKISEAFLLAGDVSRVPGHFTSGAAIEDAMLAKPERLFVVDEIGELFETMNDANAATHTKTITGALLRAYSSSGGYFKTRSRAKNKDDGGEGRTIPNPSVSIFGATVQDTFIRNIHEEMIYKGTLNRYLILETEDDLSIGDGAPIQSPIPMDIIGRLKFWMNQQGGEGDLEDITAPIGITVPYASDVARRHSAELRRGFRVMAREKFSTGEPHALYMRLWENGMKLALIRACGVSAIKPQICQADIDWGMGLAKASIDHLVAKVGDGGVVADKGDQDIEKARRIVKKGAKGDPLGHSIALKRFKHGARRFKLAMETLLETDEVKRLKDQNTGAVFYEWAG